jgi:hypothetical protein
MKHPPLHVVIDEDQFRRLVAGDPILIEIKFTERMIVTLRNRLGRPPDPPQAVEFLPARYRRK